MAPHLVYANGEEVMKNRQKWLLMSLAELEGKPLEPIQLQKAMFLMRMEAPQSVGVEFYEFKPYNYGPFDSKIYHDLESLAEKGYVNIERSSSGSWKSYSITASGAEKAKEIEPRLHEEGIAYLKEVVAWVSRVPFDKLLRSIYKRYPDYAVNSVFRG